MRGIILAGGKGTRLQPSSFVYNKHLIHVWDRPMILHAIDCLKNSGITDIVISLSYYKPEMFVDFLKDGKDFGVNLTYVIHGEPKGIAYAIYHARHLLIDKFVVYLGDNLFETDLKEYIDFFDRSHDLDCFVLLQKSSEPQRYGVAEFGDSDLNPQLVRLHEKPKEPPSSFILLGAYFFTPRFFQVYPRMKPSQRGEYEITDAINLLMPKVGYRIYEGKWWDLGTPENILNCAVWLKERAKI